MHPYQWRHPCPQVQIRGLVLYSNLQQGFNHGLDGFSGNYKMPGRLK